ncbi:glycolate oxidase subunit GlcE [Azospira restricta]|uniref:Glycolate oxidase subunit GlcE n=1 Tax=Azospira restricta TaxID=404405 RepID=A0A974SRS0_9RHOO|nr:glycolate oxidase subunit GlcE [Azospira restricta]QRJ65261.1 glycolate oxidase subunit GlcE [Azospira restricta]
MDTVLKEWIGRVHDAVETQQPLRIRGGGSKDFYGGTPAGEVLDTAAYRGIVVYEPTELVVVARAGTPLAELEAALAEKGQCLPFEPPHFGAATVGGMVAAGLSGPRRAAVGAVRDYVLGVKLIDGKGELLSFGGQVMKNVAGYDVPRLIAGSLGTLGLIAEVALKVLPLPVAERSLRFALDEAEALRKLNEWGGQPLPIAASAWHDGVLTLRLAGAHAAVDAAQAMLGGEVVADAAAFWASLREQTHAFFAGGEPLWRLSVASVAQPLGIPGPTLIEWGGAQRWLRGDQGAEQLRSAAASAGGHAALFRGGDAIKASAGVFQPLSPALLKIHRNLKQAFDPHGVFNRGRLYPDF